MDARREWELARWALVGLILFGSVWLLVDVASGGPDQRNLSFEEWYGNWPTVVIVTGVFALFVLGFVRPRRRVEWHSAGLYTAFLISLFTEMFGLPLTIYLLAPLVGLPAPAFGLNESHLWAFVLDRLGFVPLRWGNYLVMLVSMGFIAAAVSLVAVGWATVYHGRRTLVTDGIYRHVRHPQYLGLILIVLGFNVQWPTLPTLLMAPVLVAMYVRLARREDRELALLFGRAFLDYAAGTPAFVPVLRPGGRRGPGVVSEPPRRQEETP